jgi:hypothetical protein
MRLRVEDTYASIGDRVMYGYQAYMFQALRIKRDVMSERSVVFLVISQEHYSLETTRFINSECYPDYS